MNTHIVITGVSRGLGRALANWCAGQGHRVSGCSRNAEALADLTRQLGPPHAFDPVDVLDREAVEAWARRVVEAAGPPDLLINNAGIIHPDAPFVEVPAEEFDQVVQVHIRGMANVMRAFLPEMINRGTGVVVNLSSGAGVRGYGEIAGYCAAKHGVEGLSKAVAMEVPDGLAVIPLQPGVIHTGMLDMHYGSRAAEYDSPEEWVNRAGPYMMGLGPNENGQSLRIPD